MVKHQPLQVYERQLCLSCITGIYGCRWKRYQRSHDDTTKWELLWSLILLFTFCALLVWFYFWLEARNDYSEFNWFLYNRSGEWSDGTVPIMATTAAGFTYIAFLMILALCHVALGQQLNLHWLHKIGVTAALLTTVVGVISISQTWQHEWDIIPISLQATGPFLHIGAVAAFTALSWIVAGQVARAEKTSFQVVVMLLYLAMLLGLYVVPLYITSPCIMDPSNLRPRPDVIGHQGVPMLAPENTMWSFQRALQMNVTGLEADVAISVDGVPFLMRDSTLRRTTDVEKMFPDRPMQDASFFNWTDLQQLNAGQWFLKDDPFWTVQTLSPHERNLIANQSVCSLEQLLKLASYHNTSVVFRLRRPPVGHPCYNSWINDTLQATQQSRVPQSLVLWTPDEDRAQVRQIAPGLIQTSVEKQSPQSLREAGISRLLLRYNQASTLEIGDFSQRNISLTLYTVNKPWLYSVLWCSGVSSVTSEAPHVLKKVPYPIWLLRADEYCLMWVCADLISFVVVVGIFILQNYHMIRYRTSGMRSYNPEQIMLSAAVRRSSRDLNVMKEKLIFSEVGNGVAGSDEPYTDNSNDYDDYYTDRPVSQ
ncbi:glycerophosphodiester phosphodiesterase domain-containing protein 5 isoform X1 [Nerophis lumbriciformis]|uniref:glycerophosphodiester phosphodiesterase domain-containing protein 5 isoform X1 n=1 Tax=Nerophis lumbriciformis TaxID=546530 RepID=UPI002ADFDB63|nr:glycerophosphodiester phosphodiesterase domain-containing protein 5-like isoform X1 [Nerophis lumbriciformis]XP_061828845.1 glycerophosphodiester phosphodiesterase domain-containing protein 5-like isoform X1 [Nerophis lumbriciformis]